MRTATAILLLIGVVAAPAHAQPAADKKAFEVTSVKRNTLVDVETTLNVDPGGRLRAVAAPLFWLIAGAYGDARGALRPEQLVGAPPWLRSERYDITAQAPDLASTEGAAFIRARPFLQSLLEDRFQLRVYRERRELPVYALVRTGKNGELGPRLSRSNVDCEEEVAKCGFRGGPVGRVSQNRSRSIWSMALRPARQARQGASAPTTPSIKARPIAFARGASPPTGASIARWKRRRGECECASRARSANSANTAEPFALRRRTAA